MAAIRPPYTAMFNDYVRRELGYKSDLEYYILGGGIGSRWDFGSDNEYVDVGESLRSAFAKNPHMRLYIAFGYYDAATPLFAASTPSTTSASTPHSRTGSAGDTSRPGT